MLTEPEISQKHERGEAERTERGLKKKSVGFDIDGVIFSYPSVIERMRAEGVVPKFLQEFLRKHNIGLKELSDEKLAKLYDFILESPRGKRVLSRIYKKARPNKEIVNLMEELQKEGHEILAVTGFPDTTEVLGKDIAEERFLRHNIKYDGLFTREKGDSVIEHKMRKIKELGIEVFVDDVRKIIEALPPAVRGIHCEVTKKRPLKKIIEEIRDVASELRNEPTNEFLGESRGETRKSRR